MRSTTPRLVFAVLLVSACRLGSEEQQAAAKPGGAKPAAATSARPGGEVVAEAGGTRVTWDELEKRASGALLKVRQEEYEIRKRALEEMIAERLMEKEAASRGVSVAELIKAEVDGKIQPAAQSEIDGVYERNKDRLPGRSPEEVKGEIARAFRDQRVALRREAFGRELRSKAAVKIHLDAPRVDVSVPANAPALGADKAPVTIVEFSDYQCPYCRRAQGTVEQVLQQYAGKVRLVHMDFPLDNHNRAVPAARAARCAGEQERFWDYHRNLLSADGDLTDEDLKRRATALGIDMEKFSTCLASDRHMAVVREGAESGARLSVTGTPTFFVNGRVLTGARPFEHFQEVIDSELSRAQ
jgi:protein-disulfide isomerase